jgi:uncharacterized protein
MSKQRLVDDVSPSEGAIECPKCHALMKRLRAGEVDIDRCQSCQGVWLDALEKEKLLRRPKDARAADAGAATPRRKQEPRGGAVMTCPRDHSRMIRMVDNDQPHIGYEACTICGGMFFDAGELKDLSEVTIGEWVRSVVRV